MERLRPEIANLCNRLLDQFEAKPEVELLNAYATPIPVAVICDLLGAPIEMANQFLSWSHDMVSMYMAKRDRAIEDKAVAATLAFSTYMRDLIRERRGKGGDNLLMELIRAESEQGKLSEDELVTTAILMLNAGHEATVHGLGNGIKAISASEYRTVQRLRRTVFARVEIPAGTTITRDMLAIKSPGIGILPKYIDLIVGRQARTLIEADHPVTWDTI